MASFEHVKVGDVVTRMLAGTPMKLNVVGVTETLIDCGWKFDRKTGMEVDEDLGWGPEFGITGSYLRADR